MARAFNGINQRMFGGFGGALPLSCSAWINGGGATGCVFAFTNATGHHRHLLHKTSSTVIGVSSVVAGVASWSATIAIPSTGWVHVAGIWRANNDRSVYVNGARANSSGNVAVTANAAVTIGAAAADANLVYWFNGLIACPAYWNVALTDAEVASLAAGFSPDQIRPTGLVSHDLFDPRILDVPRSSGYWLNVDSTDSTDHPPIR